MHRYQSCSQRTLYWKSWVSCQRIYKVCKKKKIILEYTSFVVLLRSYYTHYDTHYHTKVTMEHKGQRV